MNIRNWSLCDKFGNLVSPLSSRFHLCGLSPKGNYIVTPIILTISGAAALTADGQKKYFLTGKPYQEYAHKFPEIHDHL